MDFGAMKRRELQALCKRHGLAGGGTNADLVARLAATLSGSGGAAAEAVGVVVGRGCLKRSAGDSDAAKRVTFELEEDEDAEAGANGRGRGRPPQSMSSPAVPKKRGRPRKAGETPPPAAKGNLGARRQTRSQAGGDSEDESDSGEAAADAPARRSVTQKSSAKAEQDAGDAAGRKHQLKRKTREDDTADVDVSGQVGVSRRSTRSSGLLLEPAALPATAEKKRGRGRPKAADVKEKTSVEEQPAEAPPSGRTLRSGAVVVAAVPPVVPASKKSRREVQEEEPAAEKAAEVEVPRRTTRSGAAAAPLASPSVTAKKRGRKTDDVHLDAGLDKEMENKRQSSRLTTRSSIHHLASTEEEASLEQGAAPSKGFPPRRSRRNPSEPNMMLDGNTTSQSSRAQTDAKMARPTMLDAAKDGVQVGVEKPDRDVGLKKSKLRKGSATSAGEIPFSDGSGKASATDMQIEVPGLVRRSTRKSVVPSSQEHETNIMDEDVAKKQTVAKPVGRSTRRSVAPVILEKEGKGLTKEVIPEDAEKKQTVTKPVGRSTRRSVAPVILEKETKGLTKEIVPEAHVKRPTRKSVVPAMLEKGKKGVITEIIPEALVKRSTWKPALPIVKNNDLREVVSTENLQSDKSEELEKQPTVKQPVRRLTRKSVVPSMLEEDRNGVPDMLNNENGDRTEMQSDQVGHLENQLVVKEHVRRPTGKSAVPDVIGEHNKGLREALKTEVTVRTPVCKSVVPNAVSKDNKVHNEFVRREELSVQTRSARTSLQVALQNDESLRRTTRQSSKLGLSPPQPQPTASKGRPAKRRRTSSLQESMPAEKQKEDQPAEEQKEDQPAEEQKEDQPTVEQKEDQPAEEQKEDHTNDVIEEATSTVLDSRQKEDQPAEEQKEDQPAEEQKEDQPAEEQKEDHTNDVIEATSTVLDSRQKEDQPAEEQKEDDMNDVIEDATSTVLDIGVLPFTVNKSDLPDSQLNSELECVVVMEPGLSCDKNDTDILECQHEGTLGTTEKPPSNLPIPDSQHGDAFSEKAVNSIENDAGRCSPIFEQSPTDLQCLFSKGIVEISTTHNAIPSPENNVEESDVHKVECRVETVVSSKSDSYQGSDENSVSVQESGGSAFSSQPNNEQEVVSVSSCPKDLAVSAQLFSSEDADHIVRDVITTDLICKEEEKKDFIPSSDINVPHEISPANEPAENAFGVSGAVFCNAQSNPCVEVNSDSSRLESLDAVDNRIASSNTEAVQQDDKEECNLHNGVTHGIHASGMSEAAQVEVIKSGKELLPVETSAFQDAQLNCEREGDEYEEHSFSCSNDRSGKNNMSQLANEYVTESCQEQEPKLPHDLSAVKSSEVSTTCQDEFAIGSGIGQASGSIIKGNNIAMDASGTAMQVENLSPSATALLMNRKDTPALKTDAPELSSDHLFEMDSSVRVVQSVSDRLREAGLAVGNPDNKLQMEQVQKDDKQLVESTLENTAPGSATLESNQQCGLSKEAEPHSLKNEISSSTVEQSPFYLQTLFPSDDVLVEGTREKAVLGSVTPDGKHECAFPDEAESHSFREKCSSSFEQPPFGLQPLFSQDDAEVQDTVEKAVTPEGKQECGLPDKAELHSSRNERCPNAEQSPFSLHPLFLHKSIEEPSENVTPSVHAKNGVDESKDIHLEYGVEKTPVPESVSDHDRSVDFSAGSESEDCAYTDQGLTKSCQGQEQMACQLDLLEAANCMEFTNPEEISYVNENKKPVHSTAISSSCKFFDANRPVKHVAGLGDGLCSSSVIAFTDDTDVHPSSNHNPFESTDFLDELKGCSSTEALQQGLKEQCDEPKENQVTLLSSSLIASTDDSDVHPSSNPSQFESTDFLDAPKGRSSTETLQQGLKERCDEPKENQVTVLSSSLVASVDDTDVHPSSNPNQLESIDSLQDLKEQCDEPKENQVSYGASPSNTIEAVTTKDLESEVPPPPPEETSYMLEYLFLQGSSKGLDMPGDLVLPSAENDDDSNTCHVEMEDEKKVSSEADSSERSDMHADLVLPSAENKDGFISYVELQADKIVSLQADSHQDSHEDVQLIAPLVAAEASALPDEQDNPELEAGEFEKCNFSGEDTSGKNSTGFQLHKDSHMDPIQGKELPNDLPAPKSPEQSTIGQDAETSASPDEQPNPELEGAEIEWDLSGEDTSGIFGTGYVKTNDLPAPKFPEQSIGQDVEASAWLDEQPNPELEGGEFEERKFCREGTLGTFDSHQGSHGDAQLIAPLLAAETSALPDEQANPELEMGEFEKCNFSAEENNLFQLHSDSHIDPIQGKELPNDLPASKSPEQSTIGQDAETLASPGEQPEPELEGAEIKVCDISGEDTSAIFGTGCVKTNDLPAPTSPEQSTIGQDTETSAWPDEQPNPELEACEFEDRKFSSEGTSGIFGTGYDEDNLFQLHENSRTDPMEGKELPNFLPAPKSPKQSIFGQHENALGSETSPLPDEKFNSELESEEHNGSVKNNACYWDDKEEYKLHNDAQATAAMLLSGMTKPTLIEGSESGMALPSAEGTPATDEQLNFKLEDDKEHNLFFDTGLMENINLFSLPEDSHTETCYEHELPIGTPAAKSAGASAVVLDGSVHGSVGICQTSGRRRVDEISKKLQRFNISSAVKGSHIAMDSPNMKQEDNSSLISLVGNTENVPGANPDHPAKLNTDWFDVKDSSRQGTTDGL